MKRYDEGYAKVKWIEYKKDFESIVARNEFIISLLPVVDILYHIHKFDCERTDMVQDAVVFLCDKVRYYSDQRSSIYNYFFTILKNYFVRKAIHDSASNFISLDELEENKDARLLKMPVVDGRHAIRSKYVANKIKKAINSVIVRCDENELYLCKETITKIISGKDVDITAISNKYGIKQSRSAFLRCLCIVSVRERILDVDGIHRQRFDQTVLQKQFDS